jgi:hypothetical protein
MAKDFIGYQALTDLALRDVARIHLLLRPHNTGRDRV